MNLTQSLRNPWFWLATSLLLIVARGLWIDVMDVDASKYASISREMLHNGSWLQVQYRKADYLDKPPLLFWTSAASFALFGLSNWAYKLPSALAAMAGVYAVYRFSKLFYTEKTARHAAFILTSSVGLVLICNDVRTDTLLLGMTACAVWQIAEYVKSGRWSNLLSAFVFIGLAMLAKGPIGLLVPAFAAGTHLLLSRDWRNLLRWQWLVGLFVTALVLAPMCWGLYQQFDMHPEKIVNDKQGVSGLYFFFWEQSFGRITGDNIWRNDTSKLYFLHVYLWAFLPWCLLLPGALWSKISSLWQNKFRPVQEAYSLGGFVLTFIALSFSQYKLPHYIFITLPWAAVLVARWINSDAASTTILKIQTYIQYFIFLFLLAGASLLVMFVFPTKNLLVWGILFLATGVLLVKIVRQPFPFDSDKLVQRSIWAVLIPLFALNFHFYPHLLPYQGPSAVGHFIHKNDIPPDKVALLWQYGTAMDFYGRTLPLNMDPPSQLRANARRLGELWLYTNARGKAELDFMGIAYETAARFEHFQVALLTPAFLNPATRAATLEPVFLLKISSEQNQ